jgi:hypothetical protein
MWPRSEILDVRSKWSIRFLRFCAYWQQIVILTKKSHFPENPMHNWFDCESGAIPFSEAWWTLTQKSKTLDWHNLSSKYLFEYNSMKSFLHATIQKCWARSDDHWSHFRSLSAIGTVQILHISEKVCNFGRFIVFKEDIR